MLNFVKNVLDIISRVYCTEKSPDSKVQNSKTGSNRDLKLLYGWEIVTTFKKLIEFVSMFLTCIINKPKYDLIC